MKISIIGTGYVGLVSGACLAELGHEVVCVDIDKDKLDKLKIGQMPIYEQGLEEIVKKNVTRNRLSFTDSYADALRDTSVVMIAVGTPPREDGSADLRFVIAATEEIAIHARDGLTVVVKSTVPVGTNDRVLEVLKAKSQSKVDVISNPEMLREGVAVNDFLRPSRIIIGSRSEMATQKMLELYAAIECPKLVMSPRSAELVKYANNAFLAAKISFINEIAQLSDAVGANVDDIAAGIGTDPRIGQAFLKAGPGWGGSCFPKDVKALVHLADLHGIDLSVSLGSIRTNHKMRSWVVINIEKALNGLRGKKIAILGLAFKGNTDDVRESPALDIIKRLHEKGAELKAFDPMAHIRDADLKRLFTRAGTIEEAVKEVDAIVIATEWDQFRAMDLATVKRLMKGSVLFDARNLISPKIAHEVGFEYHGIGRK